MARIRRLTPALTLALLITPALTFAADADAPPRPVDFDRDIRPILSDNCLACHGPDAAERKADLRLDTREGALGAFAHPDGEATAPFVPGQPDRSAAWLRIVSGDPDELMPPPDSHRTLDDAQKALIRRWIEQGAPWAEHWAFVAPKRPELPTVRRDAWVRNPIDAFVLARLEAEGLEPSAEAARTTLLRRVTLDLTGLPPTRAEVEAFLADDSPDAYERVVDRLLASPRYGERMAMVWLDAARYSDTDGYQIDATRSNWPWRDWVIEAYNANIPFDRFTLEQFAGDLLPDATADQQLATSFHRNHMTNGEGGRDPEESRVDYVIDRVNTAGTVWLGLTLGCTQCHDHKYDPITQRDYYALTAYFNSIDEDGRAGGGAKPYLKVKSPHVGEGLGAAQAWLDRKQAEHRAAEEAAKQGFDAWLADRAQRVASGEATTWHPLIAADLRANDGAALTQRGDHVIDVTGPNARHEDYIVATRPDLPRVSGMRLRVMPGAEGTDGRLTLADDGHVILTNLKVYIRTPGRSTIRAVEVTGAVADYQADKKSAKDYGPVRDVLDDDPRTGWTTVGSEPTEPRTAVFAFAEPITLAGEEQLVIELRHRSLKGQANIRRFAVDLTDEVGPAVERIGPTPTERLAAVDGQLDRLTGDDRAALLRQYLEDVPALDATGAELARARDRVNDYKKAGGDIAVMVLQQRDKPRTTHVLKRGVWDQHGEQVAESTPPALGAFATDVPADRIGLAQWLTDPANPLTARVAINRYWQMYFGEGLVRTPEDFGLQGERPTHPRLLDWLAVEFVESGWDVKHVQRLIVTSATYRQSSDRTPQMQQRDPHNRLLTRQSRFRLPSWMIRDAALRTSGLLVDRLGGPPVYPYQPAGMWADSTMGRYHYQRSVGDDLYRRSVYGFWRRSVAPTMLFDAATRRMCQVRVVRTNTPLHALTLMNDTTYVEAARVLATSVIDEHGPRDDRLTALTLAVLCRTPTVRERTQMGAQLDEALAFYRDHADDASALNAVGQTPPPAAADAVELAAYTVIATTLMNLDEALTRE